MKVLIAMVIAASSITASALPLCLARPQRINVPDELNIRFDAEIDPANPSLLTLHSHTEPSYTWVYAATADVLNKRRATLHCTKLADDFQRETLRLAIRNSSDAERLSMVLLFSIGMNKGMHVSANSTCSLLGPSQLYRLVETPQTPTAKALLGAHLLVSTVENRLLIMEGSLGFVYSQAGCAQPRLK